MAKASISIGVGDASGQPTNAPRGPYITDEDDGSRPRKDKPARAVPARDQRGAGGRRGADRTSNDLANRRKGQAQP